MSEKQPVSSAIYIQKAARCEIGSVPSAGPALRAKTKKVTEPGWWSGDRWRIWDTLGLTKTQPGKQTAYNLTRMVLRI